jgi:hypothetical protein
MVPQQFLKRRGGCCGSGQSVAALTRLSVAVLRVPVQRVFTVCRIDCLEGESAPLPRFLVEVGSFGMVSRWMAELWKGPGLSRGLPWDSSMSTCCSEVGLQSMGWRVHFEWPDWIHLLVGPGTQPGIWEEILGLLKFLPSALTVSRDAPSGVVLLLELAYAMIVIPRSSLSMFSAGTSGV